MTAAETRQGAKAVGSSGHDSPEQFATALGSALLVQAPHRVRLSRKRGWRLPENTVVVSRPSKWGNPWRPGKLYVIGREEGDDVCEAFTVEQCVTRFSHWLGVSADGRRIAEAARHELRGKNLACWCALDRPCHADVLLRLANEPLSENEMGAHTSSDPS
jgi:hypothetical protein